MTTIKCVSSALIATALTFMATASWAAFADMDSNGDGQISMLEFSTAFPDATSEAFTAVDTNADGAVTEDEYVAAVEGGLIPTE